MKPVLVPGDARIVPLRAPARVPGAARDVQAIPASIVLYARRAAHLPDMLAQEVECVGLARCIARMAARARAELSADLAALAALERDARALASGLKRAARGGSAPSGLVAGGAQ